MRPWQHASSTLGDAAAGDTPEWRDALAVHEFLDISKLACADRRHRIVLHHVDLGAAITRRAFPEMSKTDHLVAQHVAEDLGREATLIDWMAGIDAARLPRPVRRRLADGAKGVAGLVATRLSRHPDAEEAVQAVAEFLFMPQTFYPQDDMAALALLMNTAGVAIVRRIFGPPRIDWHDGRRVVVDFGWMAEAIIMASYGRIPDLRELIECVGQEPLRASRPNARAAA